MAGGTPRQSAPTRAHCRAPAPRILRRVPSVEVSGRPKPLLFLEDGQYFSAKATADHLSGTEWGVMNRPEATPGQPWLWLYTLWYQVPGFDNSANVDLIAIYLTGAATILLLAVPFIPGLRDIPRFIPLHRLVWRSWDKTGGETVPAGGPIESADEGSPDRP